MERARGLRAAAGFCLLGLLLPDFSAAQTFRPLFDGTTTKGWHLQGDGAWTAKDGMLVGTHVATSSNFGHLVSDSSYVDFTFRYRWKLVKGNSGLYYHSSEGSTAGMIGPQVEMDGEYPGGIYTTNTDPWGWVVQPTKEAVKTWYKAGDWNLVTVTVQGAKAIVTYNGLKSAETSDARLPKNGRFGFQVHANLDCEIWVDDVEIATPAPVTLMLPGKGFPARAVGLPQALLPAPGRDAMGRYRTTSRSGSASAWDGFTVRSM